jgi:hypothetical protein
LFVIFVCVIQFSKEIQRRLKVCGGREERDALDYFCLPFSVGREDRYEA